MKPGPTIPNEAPADAPIPVEVPSYAHGEYHVLCSLLGHGKPVADTVLPVLVARDFYFAQNRVIFEAIQQTKAEGRDITPESVAEVLGRKQGRLEGCGGLEKLRAYAEDAPGVRGALPNAQALKLYTERRAIISAAQKQAALAADPMQDMGAVRAKCLALTQSAVNLAETDAQTERSAQMAPRLLKEIRERRERGDKILGVSSGLASWDMTLSGMIPGRLNIVAGRPGMGKTAAMLTVATNAALRGTACIIFSLEMGKDELWYRALASLSGVNAQRIATGDITDAEDRRVEEASNLLARMPLSLNDATDITPRRLESITRKFIASTDSKTTPVMLMDYAQLLSSDEQKRGETEAQVIKTNIYEVKYLLKNLKVSNVTLAQINRSVEKREDKRPISSDLDSSGGLEQAADSITFLYRPAYYRRQALIEGARNEVGEEAERAEAERIRQELLGEMEPDEAEWIVTKVRGGIPRTLKMTFHPTRTMFTSGGLHMGGF